MTYAELTAMPPASPEALETERVVVMLQDAFKTADRGAPDPERTLVRLVSVFGAVGDERPEWLTVDLLARMIERLRRVQGQWRATSFHATLELKFP
jgi:hypothetical protein